MKTQISVFSAAWLLVAAAAYGQGTTQITFDGPPAIPASARYSVTNYNESGMSFTPISPGDPNQAFSRNGGAVSGTPDDGSAYLQGSITSTLMFRFGTGSTFSLVSADLAGYSTVVPNVTAYFTGYQTGGSTVNANIPTSGITFQTYYFGPEWSNLVRVEIPIFGSLDNLVVSVPEPSAGILAIWGAALVGLAKWKKGR